MKKTVYIKLSLILVLFLGASYPGGNGASQINPVFDSNKYTNLSYGERLSRELEFHRVNNTVTLDYIKFKVKFGNQKEYYIQQTENKP